MKIQCTNIVAVLICIFVLGAAAHGMRPADADLPAQDKEAHADRVLFDRLVRDIKSLDGQSTKLMDVAVAQARAENGYVNFVTKARLLSLRDQRDRRHSRLLILSARHDWVVPTLRTRPARFASAQESVKSVFGSVDVLVQRELAIEALQIADMVRLPVVSLE